jgi:iron complex outermembrane receptor protein
MHLRAQRQLPPTVFENASQKGQQDATTYANVGWQRNNANHGWNVELGWINENIDYQDSAIGMYSTNKANSFIFQPEYSRAVKDVHLLKLAGYHRTDIARLDAAEGQVLRHESAAITSVALALSSRWMLNANIRMGYSRSQWQPIIPSVATSFSLCEPLTAKLQFGRHYREPTLNDLYWEPGGNPDLRPEDGSSASATLSYSPKMDNFHLSMSLSGYASYIQDQIVWQPAGAYWSPYNVSEVYARGAESWIKVGHQRGRWKFRVAVGATYTGL